MNTRTIYYIDENENYLDAEVEIAVSRTPDENLNAYCEMIISNYAMMGIDVIDYPVTKEIYYINNEQGEQ